MKKVERLTKRTVFLMVLGLLVIWSARVAGDAFEVEIVGDFTVDTSDNTLHVDSSNNRVGIGTLTLFFVFYHINLKVS